MQLDQLWNYMQYDMEADKYENEMRQSPSRQKLLKQREFLLEQQNNNKKIETEVTAMFDRLEAVKDDSARLDSVLRAQIDAINSADLDNVGDIQKQATSIKKIEESLHRYEQELNKMRKDSDAREKQQKDIRIRAARTKADFDKLKQEYEAEFAKDSAQLAVLKEKVEQEGKGIDSAMLARYKKIKQHVTPPMAKLNSDRCGGCNMSLPAATLKQVSDSQKTIECDNCGRILYVPEA